MSNKHVVDITIIWPDDRWDQEYEEDYLQNCLQGIVEHFHRFPIENRDYKLTLLNPLGRVYADIHINPCKKVDAA